MSDPMKRAGLVAVAMAAAMVFAAPATAVTVGFERITGNSSATQPDSCRPN